MMERQSIAIEQLLLNPFDILANRWMLLTCGDFLSGRFNAMTISWGSIGHMWDKPFVQVVVRPSRYTYEFMEKYDTFTLSVFPLKYQPVLSLLGSRSGRDHDKIKESALTPMSAIIVTAPTFREAELVIECKKMYWDDYDPSHFLNSTIEDVYPKKDYHRVYFGEIIAIQGIDTYRLKT